MLLLGKTSSRHCSHSERTTLSPSFLPYSPNFLHLPFLLISQGKTGICRGVNLRYLISAALPYSYAPRHFGHFAGVYLPADIFARFQRMLGSEVLYVCGTDENAASIILEALKQNITPGELCDKYYPVQKDAFEKLGVSFDIFSRTSKPIHIETVGEFYSRLWQKGYIYSKKIKQWFCPKDRKVLPDRFVKGTCPKCGAEEQFGESCDVCATWYESFEIKNPHCTLCGSKPEVVESKHFFLKLSGLTKNVLEYVKTKKFWKKAAYNKTFSWLTEEGFRDKDITRDYDWGPPAPFPGADGLVIYNWAENLLGYVSATKDRFSSTTDIHEWKKFWLNHECKIYCFLGHDNLFFHTMLFPAILIAHGDYNLPHNVVVNAFVNLEGRKMDTSEGWVVWLHEILERYDPDMIRFYATMIAPETRDSEFRWRDFQAKINNELIATLANFVYRVLSFIDSNFNATLPESGTLEKEDEEILTEARKIAERVEKHIQNCEFREGMLAILSLAQLGNRYLNSRRPWEGGRDAPRAIYVAVQIVYVLSIILSPYLPFTAEKMRASLNLEKDVKKTKWNDIEKRLNYGHRINEPTPLFRKISDGEIESERTKLTSITSKPTHT